MAKVTFKFGVDSLLKLLVYLEGEPQAQTPYSFDGRYHQTGTPRLTDDPKHWNEDNARRYLQRYFAKHFQAHPRLKYAALVDKGYPTPKIKKSEWCIASQSWTSPEAAQSQRHLQHLAARAQAAPKLYSFRLAIPLLKNTPHEDAKWKNLWTTRAQTGMALIDLIGQFHAWRKSAPSVRIQSIGQLYGKPNGQFSTDETKVPRFGWFDVLQAKPKYHGTQRVIMEYAAMQEQQSLNSIFGML